MHRASSIAVHDFAAPSAQSGSVDSRRPSAPLVLWHFAISHSNEKVRWALDLKQIPHVPPRPDREGDA